MAKGFGCNRTGTTTLRRIRLTWPFYIEPRCRKESLCTCLTTQAFLCTHPVYWTIVILACSQVLTRHHCQAILHPYIFLLKQLPYMEVLPSPLPSPSVPFDCSYFTWLSTASACDKLLIFITAVISLAKPLAPASGQRIRKHGACIDPADSVRLVARRNIAQGGIPDSPTGTL